MIDKSFKKLTGKQNGISLVEILIYVSIFCVLLVAIVSFIFWTIQSSSKTKVIGETLDNANRAMDIMLAEIKEAKSIYTPTTNSNQLSLETSDYLPDGEDTSYIDFYICNNRICLKREGQDPVAITSDSVRADTLAFTQIFSGGRPSVRVNLTVSYNGPAGRPEYQSQTSLASTASLRPY